MPQIYPDQGLLQMLHRIVENAGSGLTWALYTNDLDPTLDSLLSDFTLGDPGWAQVVLVGTDFVNEIVNLHVGTIQAPTIQFKNTGVITVDVYGYVIFDQVGRLLIAANRFEDSPITMIVNAVQPVPAIIGDYSSVLTDIIDGGTF